ncbi:hypothetical protein FCG40_06400 [Fimbriimonadia bacterium ATM]|nr:MAG: hypothetical protein EDM73_12110 [Armatimonadota bacterium]MBC6970087.1 hypothetical protein [Armatimonadota bacterium]MCE7900725.1 hypothetical protein [Armatimonadetes bacterium ATM1]MDL1928605.1 hypothetical protein [Fimbriimonadia bacterium ATM]RIJ96198.1 MAG: hypothetical protein DCC45_08070 [Armatimonadota bacterium]
MYLSKRVRILSAGLLLVTVGLMAITAVAGREPVARGSVTLYLSTDCPVAMKYTPRINRLFTEFGSKGISFRALFPNDLETPDKVKAYATERDYKFPCQLDEGARQAKDDAVEIIPTIVIRDANGKKVYQGAIDDNLTAANVKQRYAANVLSSLTQDKAVSFTSTKSFGCFLMPPPSVESKPAATYADSVAHIVFDHCTPCHRPGEVAPFSLTTFEEARKWSQMIAYVAEKRIMPPWKAVSGFNRFKGENLLTDAEIATLKQWADAGAPRGDEKTEPKAPSFSSEWTLGTPDLVLMPEKAFEMPGEGRDIYRNFVIKTNFKETKWISAMDVKPGNPRVVHHVIAFLDERDRALQREQKQNDGQPGYTTFGGVGFNPDGALGGWAPGLRPNRTAPGTAFELKPGTTIVLQVHYHLSGKPEKDQTKVGLYFSNEKDVTKPVRLAWIANPFFRIPPGEKDHKVNLAFPIPADVTAYGAMPHMHLLGKSMKAEVEGPDGKRRPLVWIDSWDFNWQLTYIFAEPMKVKAGSKIVIEAIYDNSPDNPNNPNNPPQEVRWGEQTTDEMFLLIVPFTVDAESRARPRQVPPRGGG